MLDEAQLLETGTLLGLIVAFEIAERARPARALDRRAALRIDVLSFALALAMSRASTSFATRVIDAAGPADALLARLRDLPWGLRLFLSFVLVDFVLYWFHRAQHRFAPLWRTHAWHHSVRELYWFSGFRTSFLHSLAYNLPQTAVPLWLFGLSPLQAALGFAIGILVQFWEHTNLRVAFGPLRHVLITPQYHRIHHAAAGLRDKNFAFIFPVWDRLFGTQVDAEHEPDDFALGLEADPAKRELPRYLVGV
jgi:sterol desaturase/sphingolipid hydroxylase (fatty acid hydroxylase superfamily)